MKGYMTSKLVSKEDSSHLQCKVCGGLIISRSVQSINEGDLTCGVSRCKRVMEKKPYLPPWLFSLYLKLHRLLDHQRRKVNAKREKYINNVIGKEQRENNAILTDTLKKHPELSRESISVVVIPRGFLKASSLSNARVKNYTNYLTCIINSATEYADASDVDSDEHREVYRMMKRVDQQFENQPNLQHVSEVVCSVCKGGCCTAGEDHAYLSVFGIRRYLDANRELSKQQVLEQYLQYLPSETVLGGCINQTQTGCVLPRKLRSDICNGYYCESLKDYQDKMDGGDNTQSVLAIQRAYTHWQRFDPGASGDVVDTVLIRGE